MKSVLISIKPKWCGPIASGKKTLEVRKTRPKIETPFKCYIYQCLPKYGDWNDRDGRVIGEFVCNEILPISVKYSNPNHRLAKREFPFTGMTDKEIMDYLGNGKTGYAWHISDLKIYEEPKELSKFRIEDKAAIKICEHRFRTRQPEYVARHGGWPQGGFICMKSGEPEWCENCVSKPLTRPSQSWCYVEEVL